jgi:hypothetical protein
MDEELIKNYVKESGKPLTPQTLKELMHNVELASNKAIIVGNDGEIKTAYNKTKRRKRK